MGVIGTNAGSTREGGGGAGTHETLPSSFASTCGEKQKGYEYYEIVHKDLNTLRYLTAK